MAVNNKKVEGLRMETCPCCGGTGFIQNKVLWKELISEWGLHPEEVEYIDRQQGLACDSCGSNLRSMTLAYALSEIYNKTFPKLLNSSMSVLEINEAGQLNKFFKNMRNHHLVEYPETDMLKLPISDNSYDLVVHSDTLEHVSDPLKGLKETLRVMKPGGFTVFTIPLIIDRQSKTRGKKASYHGSPGNKEYLVYTEFGSDMWTHLFQAGFKECRLVSIDYPASIAIVGRKPSSPQSLKEKSKNLISKIK